MEAPRTNLLLQHMDLLDAPSSSGPPPGIAALAEEVPGPVNEQEGCSADGTGLRQDLGRLILADLDVVTRERCSDPVEAAELDRDIPHEAIAVDGSAVRRVVPQFGGEEVAVSCEVSALECGPHSGVHRIEFRNDLRSFLHAVALATAGCSGSWAAAWSGVGKAGEPRLPGPLR